MHECALSRTTVPLGSQVVPYCSRPRYLVTPASSSVGVVAASFLLTNKQTRLCHTPHYFMCDRPLGLETLRSLSSHLGVSRLQGDATTRARTRTTIVRQCGNTTRSESLVGKTPRSQDDGQRGRAVAWHTTTGRSLLRTQRRKDKSSKHSGANCRTFK